MEEITRFVLELYQIGFISSILLLLYVVSTFSIKLYGRIGQNKDTKYQLSKVEKVLFWISIAVCTSYLM